MIISCDRNINKNTHKPLFLSEKKPTAYIYQSLQYNNEELLSSKLTKVEDLIKELFQLGLGTTPTDYLIANYRFIYHQCII